MSASPLLERPRQSQVETAPRERAGDLYERYYDRLYGYCLYKLGNRQEAEDAVQTTFLWVLRALEHGIEPRMEANWLFTIAQNACRARIRTRGRKREQETLSDPQVLEQVAPGRPTAQDDLLGLEEALRDMPELQRQAIILREWRGFSYKEIAAELKLTDAAVETLIFRARRSLASRLENPHARPAKRAQVLAINFAPLSSTFKSLVGLGGAVKVAAVAATVAALGIGVGLSGDTPKKTKPAAAPTPSHVQAERHPGSTSRAAQPMKARTTGHGTGKPSKSDVPRSGSSQQPADAPAVAGPLTDGVEDAVAPATGLAAGVVDQVDSTVTDAKDAVEPILQSLPQAPAVPPLQPLP